MANTITSDLLTQQLSGVAIAQAPALVGKLADVATLIPCTEAVKRTRQVLSVTNVPAMQSNPTAFQGSADSTYGNAPVTPEHLAQIFHLSNEEISNGLLPVHLVKANLRAFTTGLFTSAASILTAANFTGSPFFTGAAETFGPGDIPDAIEAVPSAARSLILESEYYARIATNLVWANGRWTLPGFVSVIEANGLPANIGGAVISPDAITLAVGLPELPRWVVNQPSRRDFQIGELGISASTFAWVDPSTRNIYLSFEAILAAAVGQAGQCSLLTMS